MANGGHERNLTALATWTMLTKVLLAVFGVVAALVATVGAFLSFNEFASGTSFFLVTAPLLELLLVLTALPAGVALSIWVWQAHSNLDREGIEGITYSPGWAAASQWVPGANLVIPMRAMRQLWNISHGEVPELANQGVGKIVAWWCCFVCGALLESWLVVMVAIDRGTIFHFLTPPGANSAFLCASSAMLAAAAWLLFRIVGTIARAQQTVTHVGDIFD